MLSDVYSLGAVLYELLVGVAPRRFEQLTPSAMARTIERPIPMPSAATGDARPRDTSGATSTTS